MSYAQLFRSLTSSVPKIFFIFATFLIFNSLSIPDTEAAKTIKVGIYNNKPLVFVDAKGEPKGIFVDLLNHIAAKEQWNLEYVFGSWPECLDRLESGKIDLLTGIASSTKRAKKYNFTYESVITNWGQIYVSKDSGIKSILDLDGKKISVKMKDIHHYGIRELVSKFNMNCRFVEADGYDVVFELIKFNRVHAGVVNRLFGMQNKAGYAVQETPIMFNPIEVKFASPKHYPKDLISKIDSHLRKMHSGEDPIYSKTLNNWLIAKPEWVLPDTIKYTLIGVVLISFLLALMSFTLRIKVKKRTKELSATNNKLEMEIKTRKLVEEELRKYEKIVASSNDHMAMIDLSYIYQAMNLAYLNAINKTWQEVIGKKSWEVLGVSFPKNGHKKLLDRAFSGEIVNYRTWMHFPILGKRYMDIVYTPYTQCDNQIAGCVINSRDITDRYELEKKLENAKKMEFMGTIAGGVAHDLNNILSGIVSYPELLLMQLPKDSKMRKPIETIKDSGEKAAVIVQDLLTLARRGVANRKQLDLNEIITVLLNSPECEKIKLFHPNVHIKTDLSKTLNPLSGSSVHLSKTVMNLISNAAEAMPDGGEIFIKTRRQYLDASIICNTEALPGEYILLEIKDNGTGISQEDINNIFEPFYTKKAMGRSGTGLGLAVVWGTVMDHYGHIEVVSDGHSGTVFKLYFPVSYEEAQSPERIKDIQAYKGNGEKILVVDDIEAQREIASDILLTLGYKATSMSSGEDAIDYLKVNSVDMVILDMLMPPGMDGLTTYEEILKIRPSQKAIIASGFAETNRVKKALDLGVGQFIKKPYTLMDIGFSIAKGLME
ncbi:two component system sensor histidine kinase, hybrid [Desulfosarcina variabilis str. Montpellier]|uniref:ATP-binding protein n=1 Tax=Desulfosarcina variabilis TaxID=2300 RepID=UPI003AFA4D2E